MEAVYVAYFIPDVEIVKLGLRLYSSIGNRGGLRENLRTVCALN